MGSLKNKVAIVTGGARDIGKAISIKLALEGAKVIVNYFHSKQEVLDTVKEIKSFGGEATAIRADLSNLKGIREFRESCIQNYGSEIDILVNNSGGLVARKLLDEFDENFFEEVINLNFKSTVFVIQAFQPLMKNGSSIVNISSQAARDGGGAGSSLYASSKGAVSTFTRSMAKELGAKGIRVNGICPGLIGTKFHDDFTKDDIRKKVASNTPLKREGTPKEVADLALFLASPKASFINGANIDINGGLAFS